MAFNGSLKGNSSGTEANRKLYRFSTDGTDSDLAVGSYAYDIFQADGKWENPYPPLRINYHTGVEIAGNSDYGGIKFKRDYNNSTTIFQANGPSNYNYSYAWLFINNGIYSSTNSAHWEPNTSSDYSQWRMRGSRGGYGGFYDSHSAVHWMWDSSGNGGNYRVTDGWSTYWNNSRDCLGVGASTTSSSYTIYSSGAIYSTGNITAYSDRRKKENIETIDNALEKVCSLRGVYYNKIDDETKTKQMGVIAQEVQEVVPEVVNYAEDIDEYGVSYGNMVGILIEAVKEQQGIIENLNKEIKELKEKI